MKQKNDKYETKNDKIFRKIKYKTKIIIFNMECFECIECDYKTHIKCNYVRHINSKKHKEFNKLQNLCIKKIGSLIKDKKNFIVAKKKMNIFKQDIVRPRNISLSIQYFVRYNLSLCQSLLDLVYYGGRIHNKYLDKNSKNYNFEFVKIVKTFLNK